MVELLQERFQQPPAWQWDTLVNARGRTLRYGGSPAANGAPLAHIVFVEGLSEFAEKTFELARDYNAAGCAFWVLDRQGQGGSERSLRHKFKQHAENLDDDADDLIRFVRDVIPHDAPVVLQGNSAGGLLALLAMRKAPQEFAGAVLTAPLLGIANPIVKNREKLFARLPMPRFFREWYMPGDGDWCARDSAQHRLKPPDYSGDPDRMRVQDHWQRANETLRVGSATWGWLRATCRAISVTRDHDWLRGIHQPVEIFTGGRDVLVNNDYTVRALPWLKNASLHHVPEGRHELLMETDAIRAPILQATLALARKLAVPA